MDFPIRGNTGLQRLHECCLSHQFLLMELCRAGGILNMSVRLGFELRMG
jgi:hypothetical protein